jgi:hypothetical protein
MDWLSEGPMNCIFIIQTKILLMAFITLEPTTITLFRSQSQKSKHNLVIFRLVLVGNGGNDSLPKALYVVIYEGKCVCL